MGQREVHSSHIFDLGTGTCKGCGVHLSEQRAVLPCDKLYRPPPKIPGIPHPGDQR